MITGLKKLLKDLDKLPEDIRQDVVRATQDNAIQIHKSAHNIIRSTAFDLGELAGSGRAIDTSKSKKEIEYSIVFRAKHAPYIEFGTGGLVSVPPELKSLAIKFKGKGIKKVNIRPRPFLYPSLIKQTRKYINDLEDVLERNAERI